MKSWVVGSNSSCDVVVAVKTVSGQHCRLSTWGQQVLIEDLGSSNGTYVNGERIKHPQLISTGDEVRLGKTVKLEWPIDMLREIERAVGAESITIGFDEDNEIALPHPTVSSRHAKLVRSGNNYLLVDDGSKNGTSVGRKENQIWAQEVVPEDIVYFGGFQCSVADLMERYRKSHGVADLVSTEALAPYQPTTFKLTEKKKSKSSSLASIVIGLLLLTGVVLAYFFWFR